MPNRSKDLFYLYKIDYEKNKIRYIAQKEIPSFGTVFNITLVQDYVVLKTNFGMLIALELR